MVKFQESGHKYFTIDGERELISVSGLMHKFEKPKNWVEIAKKKSNNLKKYEGVIKSPDTLLKEWEEKRIKGTEAGTMVHKVKEQELLARKGEVTMMESVSDADYKYALNIKQLENNTIYPELMIYDLDYGICGQSDEVEIKNGIIYVRDYKTDKSIEKKAFSSQYTEAEKFLPPLSHLDNCNYNAYSLKMSLYMYLIWKANKGKYKPGTITLIWCPIDRDEDGIPILYNEQGEPDANGKPRILKEELVEVPYRKKEVIAMLETLIKK